MGVTASGKTTITSKLHDILTDGSSLRIGVVEADAFHSDANIVKMANGIPLTDEDRNPWLGKVHAEIKYKLYGDAGGNDVVLVACSALKRVYRKLLRCGDKGDAEMSFVIVFLNGSKELLEKRIRTRQDHFMKATHMVESQLETLEVPTWDECDQLVVINIDATEEDIVASVKCALSM
ncbi:gluconokinase [Synchytrium endobioticum]|uniref:Gluconokinase n=1 Tax=Synchytrium endobioticum TaxID=286115 RepID=A0A507CU49_9FUNG|nr:gluconokinase [Synchytrium endobioticum]